MPPTKYQLLLLLIINISLTIGQNAPLAKPISTIANTNKQSAVTKKDTIHIFNKDTAFIYTERNRKQLLQKFENNELKEVIQIKLVVNVDTLYRIRDSVQIMTVISYPSYIKHGIYKAYSPRQQIETKGKYYLNLKYGVWKYYENGHLIKMERYNRKKVRGYF